MKTAIGVDLGGTYIKGAIVDETGQILIKDEIPTLVEAGPEAILERIAGFAIDLAARARLGPRDITGVGVGIPGFIDDDRGEAAEVVNLGWRCVPVRAPLEKRLGLRVYMENDANAAALGEAWAGAGKERGSALCVTLGTGVGGGIVLNGRVWRGESVMAGEIGHIVLERDGAPCNCGQRGCLETVASATGVVRLMKEAIASGAPSSVHPEGLTAADVFRAAEQGDKAALQVVSHTADILGWGLAIAANIVNPAVIIIGGGMARAGEVLFAPVRAAFEKNALRRVRDVVEIVPAVLGNDAGVVGAAKLALYA